MRGKTQRLRVVAPEGLAPLQIAQAVVGNGVIVKAEPVPRYGKRTFRRYKTMLTLTDRFERAYEAQLKEMVGAVRTYIEAKLKVQLSKADQRPMFTPGELWEMQQIIENYHQAFIAGTIGPETLPPGAVKRLQDAGILPADLGHTFDPHGAVTPPEAMRVIEDAYRYGHVLAAARTAQERSTAHNISYEQFKRKHAPKIPLGRDEKHAIDWLKASAFNEIKGLGNKVADDFTTIAIEADKELRRKYTGVIRSAMTENVERSEAWREAASEMGHKTGDWARDFKRIAATEKQKAMQEGQVKGLIERYGDPEDVRVAKQPNPDACPACVKVHYTRGAGSPLRIFKLSELIANGSNVGKKQANWQATVGPVHPWCFLPDTKIQTSDGPCRIELIEPGLLVLTHANRYRAVQRAAKRRFQGDLIVLALGKKRLKVTPEHPLLTSRGWVRAELIKPGDDLLQIQEPLLAYPEPKDLYSEDRAERFLARILGALACARVPVGIDFDDYPEIGEPEIRIERSYSELWDRVIAYFDELTRCEGFERGERGPLLACLCRLDLLSWRPRFSAYSGVCCLREALSLFRAAASSDDPVCLSDGPDLDPMLAQAVRDRAARCLEVLGQLFDALAPLVESGDLFDGEIELSHDVEYRGVPVRSIERKPHKGFVYNFSVEEDESYVAHGFVAHNCGCEIIQVPEGWGFDEDNNLVPEALLRSDWLDWDLRKAAQYDAPVLPYTAGVPDEGVVVRIGDPEMRAEVEKVIAKTPPEIFHRDIGITFITTDIPRVQNPLDDLDFAYWSGNEIRISLMLDPKRIARVLPHEIGHSLNIYLIRQLKSIEAVKAWHRRLYRVSAEEGFVSAYAKREPIENAAEVTMLYLYHRKRLMIRAPRQFAFVHKAYRGIFRGDNG